MELRRTRTVVTPHKAAINPRALLIMGMGVLPQIPPLKMLVFLFPSFSWRSFSSSSCLYVYLFFVRLMYSKSNNRPGADKKPISPEQMKRSPSDKTLILNTELSPKVSELFIIYAKSDSHLQKIYKYLLFLYHNPYLF